MKAKRGLEETLERSSYVNSNSLSFSQALDPHYSGSFPDVHNSFYGSCERWLWYSWHREDTKCQRYHSRSGEWNIFRRLRIVANSRWTTGHEVEREEVCLHHAHCLGYICHTHRSRPKCHRTAHRSLPFGGSRRRRLARHAGPAGPVVPYGGTCACKLLSE